MCCHRLSLQNKRQTNRKNKTTQQNKDSQQKNMVAWTLWCFLPLANAQKLEIHNTFFLAVIYGTVMHRHSPCAPFVSWLRQIPSIFFHSVSSLLCFFFPHCCCRHVFSSLISPFPLFFSCSSLGDTEHGSLAGYPNTL